MYKDYKVTVDDDPTPDWLVFLEISLFLIALPIGVLYLIIKGIIKLVEIHKEKKAKKEMAIIDETLRLEEQSERINELKRQDREKAMSDLSKWHSLMKQGAISKSEYEVQKNKLMAVLNQEA